MPHLTQPTTTVHASYLEAVEEYQRQGGYPDFDGLAINSPDAFATYVTGLRHDPRSGPARITAPPMSLLWWIEDTCYIGRISIWHRLDADLVVTGHIGYDIRPSLRGQGHASRMLAAPLPHAHALGIDSAILTTRPGNAASQAVITRNGGRLIDVRDRRLYYEVTTATTSV